MPVLIANVEVELVDVRTNLVTLEDELLVFMRATTPDGKVICEGLSIHKDK